MKTAPSATPPSSRLPGGRRSPRPHPAARRGAHSGAPPRLDGHHRRLVCNPRPRLPRLGAGAVPRPPVPASAISPFVDTVPRSARRRPFLQADRSAAGSTCARPRPKAAACSSSAHHGYWEMASWAIGAFHGLRRWAAGGPPFRSLAHLPAHLLRQRRARQARLGAGNCGRSTAARGSASDRPAGPAARRDPCCPPSSLDEPVARPAGAVHRAPIVRLRRLHPGRLPRHLRAAGEPAGEGEERSPVSPAAASPWSKRRPAGAGRWFWLHDRWKGLPSDEKPRRLSNPSAISVWPPRDPALADAGRQVVAFRQAGLRRSPGSFPDQHHLDRFPTTAARSSIRAAGCAEAVISNSLHPPAALRAGIPAARATAPAVPRLDPGLPPARPPPPPQIADYAELLNALGVLPPDWIPGSTCPPASPSGGASGSNALVCAPARPPSAFPGAEAGLAKAGRGAATPPRPRAAGAAHASRSSSPARRAGWRCGSEESGKLRSSALSPTSPARRVPPTSTCW